MAKESAGLVLFRRTHGQPEFLLTHPGGPLWQNKDLGAWSIPKGEVQPSEDRLAAAQREVEEELGFKPQGSFIPLTPIRQKSGKMVHAWALEADWDPAELRSNCFSLQWPPRSGKFQEFPEVDRAAFFSLDAARTRINPAQLALLEELATKLGRP